MHERKQRLELCWILAGSWLSSVAKQATFPLPSPLLPLSSFCSACCSAHEGHGRRRGAGGRHAEDADKEAAAKVSPRRGRTGGVDQCPSSAFALDGRGGRASGAAAHLSCGRATGRLSCCGVERRGKERKTDQSAMVFFSLPCLCCRCCCCVSLRKRKDSRSTADKRGGSTVKAVRSEQREARVSKQTTTQWSTDVTRAKPEAQTSPERKTNLLRLTALGRLAVWRQSKGQRRCPGPLYRLAIAPLSKEGAAEGRRRPRPVSCVLGLALCK